LTRRRTGERAPERVAALEALAAGDARRLASLHQVEAARREAVQPAELAPLWPRPRPGAATRTISPRARARRKPDAIRRAAPAGRGPDAVRARSPRRPHGARRVRRERETLQAYVLTKQRLDLVDLGERGPIEERVGSFQEGLALRRAASTREVTPEAAELYRDLLAAPLRALETPPDHLVVVPTPALASLPFEALVTGPAPRRTRPRGSRTPRSCCGVRGRLRALCAVLAELASIQKRAGPASVLAARRPGQRVGLPRGRELAAAGSAPVRTLMGSSLRRLVAFARGGGSRVAAILDPARSEAWRRRAGEFAAGERNALASDRYLLLGGPEATPARFLAEAPRFACAPRGGPRVRELLRSGAGRAWRCPRRAARTAS
jgi:hypothetical protein